jgi:hypothetical protein
MGLYPGAPGAVSRNYIAAVPELQTGLLPDRSDHIFDALVCAVLARAAAVAATEPVPENARREAREEGWIHLPRQQLGDRPSRPSATSVGSESVRKKEFLQTGRFLQDKRKCPRQESTLRAAPRLLSAWLFRRCAPVIAPVVVDAGMKSPPRRRRIFQPRPRSSRRSPHAAIKYDRRPRRNTWVPSSKRPPRQPSRPSSLR